MTFDELFKDHNLTPAERAALVDFLANLRAATTRKALTPPPERIGGPCGVCGQPNALHGGGACPAGFVLVQSPITEEMHQAACKVLLRASGLDGTPQRLLDALAANPIPSQGTTI